MTARRTVLAASGLGIGSLLAGSPATAATHTPGPRGSRWQRLPDVPPNPTDWSDEIPVSEPYWRQLGLAGPVAGAHGDFLVVAGGANFPEPTLTASRSPKLGKVYWNDAFVLRRDGRSYEWVDVDLQIPDALAYPACVSTPNGVVVIGGEGFRGGPNGSAVATVEKFADVFRLRFDARNRTLVREDLPPLPRPLSYGAAALVGETVFVAEGETFYSLDLADPGAEWQTLSTWPGDPRTVAVAASDGRRFYLLSGRAQHDDGSWTLYTDAFAYDPGRARWTKLADLPWCIMAGVAIGDRHGITAYAGDGDVERWDLIQEFTADGRNDLVTWLQDHHTGFNTDVLGYDVRRDRWSVVDSFPGPSQVTTPAVEWDGDLVITSGEVRPGVRTPAVWRVGR
ncbi:galactose oxidase [Solicola gregarius]|uniref:Galactose oxidase n=1 Tax=Solicola gregarius TaxID=2908642 RepID=A0AA46THQ6_9ACTN|nr:galactose oxidase [Solicola gregarius]UYM05574.1 galactose oxidase [Solicola gregarius]